MWGSGQQQAAARRARALAELMEVRAGSLFSCST